MTRADPAPERCAVCLAASRWEWASPRLRVAFCPGCGHRTADHRIHGPPDSDYHDQYEQGAFVEALAATRRRQARRILSLVRAETPGARRLLDFGCGRGWLLEEAARAGFDRVAGADASRRAVTGLRDRGLEAVLVPAGEPDRFDAAQLSFRPQVLTLLDVVEHFAPERAGRILAGLLASLGPEVEVVVVKVPDSGGLLYRIASVAARVGARGALEQLYQVGTSPPHRSYFSRRSLQALLAGAGLEGRAVLGDRDFEPRLLRDRVATLQRTPRAVGALAGWTLAACAGALDMHDALVCLARVRRDTAAGGAT